MEVSGFWAVFLLGAAGGVGAELVKWHGLRESEDLPKYLRSIFYWLITVAMIAVGGGLAVLYGTSRTNALLAVNVGASAPLIISSLARNVPPKEKEPARASLRSFVAGR